MLGYFIFIFLIIILSIYAEFTRKKGFEKLKIKRYVDRKAVVEGENFLMTTIIENNKWLPISFLNVEEKLPKEVVFSSNIVNEQSEGYYVHSTRYSVLWYERLKRTYKLNGNKRGTYALKEIDLTIGDIFGFANQSSKFEDYIELLVYPKIYNIKNFNFNTNSLQGDNIIRRWIYKDPMYVKSIREYSVEDRMKDINWKYSLKQNKLMVKDYDYTSDSEIMLILNGQFGEPYYSVIKSDIMEDSIKLCVSLAAQCLKESIPVGMWTNAHTIAYSNEYKGEVSASLSSFKSILELCARVSTSPRMEFFRFLNQKSLAFNKNCTYIIITAYMDEASRSILYRLCKSGISIKIVDMSKEEDLDQIKGIENIKCGGVKVS